MKREEEDRITVSCQEAWTEQWQKFLVQKKYTAYKKTGWIYPERIIRLIIQKWLDPVDVPVKRAVGMNRGRLF